MDVAGGGHAQPALQGRPDVGDDVAEHVVGHDHLELRRVEHHLHGQVVREEVDGLDARVLVRDVLEHALPEVVGVDEHVGLVRHHDLRTSAGLGVVEGVADDPRHALARVDVHLRRDLVRCALLEIPAHHHVEAFRVLAEDHEVDVLGRDVLQRAELGVEEPHRTVVHVQVEAEPHAEQDVGGVAVVGHARVAQRAEQDGVEAALQHLQGALGQRDARLQIMIRAPFEMGETDGARRGRRHRLQRPHRFRGDLDADPVTGHDRDAQLAAHRAALNSGTGT